MGLAISVRMAARERFPNQDRPRVNARMKTRRKESTMLTRTMGCGVTAAFLLSSSAVASRAQDGPHLGHGAMGHVHGPLPDAVRIATDPYRDVNNAIAAGYVQFQGCVSGPDEGAMGVHYAKFSLFDGAIDVATPEVLVYEPRNNGLRLVAAEYVIPAPLWDPTHDPFDKPQLMGHLLQFAPGPNRYGPDAIYELHVWAWRENPHGTFSDWNPNVSCIHWDGF
jgi:hypothetical protein